MSQLSEDIKTDVLGQIVGELFQLKTRFLLLGHSVFYRFDRYLTLQLSLTVLNDP